MSEDKEESFIRIDFLENEEGEKVCAPWWSGIEGEDAVMPLCSGIAALITSMLKQNPRKMHGAGLAFINESINAMVTENLLKMYRDEKIHANSS